MDFRQGAALALIAVLIINLVLLGMGKISELTFWLTIAAIAVSTLAYKKKYKAAS
jgi:hypothetical protein